MRMKIHIKTNNIEEKIFRTKSKVIQRRILESFRSLSRSTSALIEPF